MKSEQRFAIELQAEDGRRISGVLLAYGVVAVLPWGEEKFEPHAFDVYSADVSLTIQHDRSRPVARTGAGLTLRNSSKALSMEAEILRTREGDAALVNIKGGVLRALSVEFRAVAERQETGVRIIERAKLLGLSIIDNSTYEPSVVPTRAESKTKDQKS